jgi:PIN domain nuclease of toxin-antitoxin system
LGGGALIVLDTHIWIWWVNKDARLTVEHERAVSAHESTGLAVSAISCWEVAKLVEVKRLMLDRPVENWIDAALKYPGIKLIELTPQIVVESTRLPGPFHRDPADQIIVATARILNCPLLTADERILQYPSVTTLP